MMDNLQSLFGLCIFILFCFCISANRKKIDLLLIVKGLALQVLLALLLLKIPAMQSVFLMLNRAVDAIQSATEAGTSFVFGYLGGAPVPYAEVGGGDSFIIAFRVLPMILVVSVLSGLLIYFRILPFITHILSLLLKKTLNVSGAVGLAISANAFLGMVEAPLMIKSYLSRLTSSELFSVMLAGMATIAGTMLAIEAAVIKDIVPNAVGHLVSASIITLPAVVYISHLMVPNDDTGDLKTANDGNDDVVDDGPSGLMDVITTSTQAGLELLLNIVAMIVVVVALVHLLNGALGLVPSGDFVLSLENLLGHLMAPVAWLMGVSWSEAKVAGQLMGTKTVLTEFLAYIQFSQLPDEALSNRSSLIMTYALCGFANFISLGIMITGLVTMVPGRRKEILGFGAKALIGGTIATCTTACVIGIIV